MSKTPGPMSVCYERFHCIEHVFQKHWSSFYVQVSRVFVRTIKICLVKGGETIFLGEKRASIFILFLKENLFHIFNLFSAIETVIKNGLIKIWSLLTNCVILPLHNRYNRYIITHMYVQWLFKVWINKVMKNFLHMDKLRF